MRVSRCRIELKRIIKLTIGKIVQWLVFLIFFVIKQLRIYCVVEKSVQIISFIVRNGPENRTPPVFIKESMLLKEHRFDYIFKSSKIDVVWTASAFPDLLTRHMMFEGMYQEDVLVSLNALANKGDVVYDVGGHHGLMATTSSMAVGKTGMVITFEPNPHARNYLEKHLVLNSVKNVIVESIALSDKQDKLPFYIQTGKVSWNSTLIKKFIYPYPENFTETIMVKTVTLDDYVTQSKLIPNVIKIDVEGSDFKILSGAEKTIKKHKPALIMEFNSLAAHAAGHSITEYVDFLRSASYRLFVLKRNILGYYKFNAQEPFDEIKHTEGNNNVICVPINRPT
jgi:FkbM family methyltransferase